MFKTSLLCWFSAKESGPKVWCAMVRDENPNDIKYTTKDHKTIMINYTNGKLTCDLASKATLSNCKQTLYGS